MAFKYIVNNRGEMLTIKEVSPNRYGTPRYKIVSGNDQYFIGKTVEHWPQKSRTMKPNQYGFSYDPNGVEKTANIAVHFRGRSGSSVGHLCNDIDEAKIILENAKKHSVGFLI